jgi:hypothetical protein
MLPPVGIVQTVLILLLCIDWYVKLALYCCSGSGYLSAAMAKLVAPNGFVLGVDKVC